MFVKPPTMKLCRTIGKTVSFLHAQFQKTKGNSQAFTLPLNALFNLVLSYLSISPCVSLSTQDTYKYESEVTEGAGLHNIPKEAVRL